jgi:endogenous inhibitor of DNA gyrase (YacG/DUF329 family)
VRRVARDAAAAHILRMRKDREHNVCPICGKKADEKFKPFCSRRCADVDLHRWLSGAYAVPVVPDEEPEQRTDDGIRPGQRGSEPL